MTSIAHWKIEKSFFKANEMCTARYQSSWLKGAVFSQYCALISNL